MVRVSTFFEDVFLFWVVSATRPCTCLLLTIFGEGCALMEDNVAAESAKNGQGSMVSTIEKSNCVTRSRFCRISSMAFVSTSTTRERQLHTIRVIMNQANFIRGAVLVDMIAFLSSTARPLAGCIFLHRNKGTLFPDQSHGGRLLWHGNDGRGR